MTSARHFFTNGAAAWIRVHKLLLLPIMEFLPSELYPTPWYPNPIFQVALSMQQARLRRSYVERGWYRDIQFRYTSYSIAVCGSKRGMFLYRMYVDLSIRKENLRPVMAPLSSSLNAGDMTLEISLVHFVRCNLMGWRQLPTPSSCTISPIWSISLTAQWQHIATASFNSTVLTAFVVWNLLSPRL